MIPSRPTQRMTPIRPRRVRSLLPAIVLSAVILGGCGSDEPQQPASTTPVSVVDGRQGAGPGGANDNGKDTGDTVDAPQTTAVATADTQEQIGDQSPGGGDSNGLPMGSTGP